jgi:histone H3/H4
MSVPKATTERMCRAAGITNIAQTLYDEVNTANQNFLTNYMTVMLSNAGDAKKLKPEDVVSAGQTFGHTLTFSESAKSKGEDGKTKSVPDERYRQIPTMPDQKVPTPPPPPKGKGKGKGKKAKEPEPEPTDGLKSRAEILYYQGQRGLFTPGGAFMRIAKEIGDKINKEMKYSSEFFLVLQETMERHALDLLGDARKLTIHGKRQTTNKDDVSLARDLRRDPGTKLIQVN